VSGALESKACGWPGVKLKVSKPRAGEDLERLRAVREAVGAEMDIMVDAANQSMTYAEAKRRARMFEEVDVFWFEEPLPAEDITGHARLVASTSIPVAVGESLYSPSHFREYLQSGGASIVQVDARIGGITSWLKTAHLAEAFNAKVAPHFLMELHASLAAAVPNVLYVEHIPQLRVITTEEIRIVGGHTVPPSAPGIGIAWDRGAMEETRVE
jgi:L-alanine-DL-glutamate epimerase-like enolase superfamily enzyme